MLRGMLSLLGITFSMALFISHGLTASFDEDFTYPDRATRQAAQYDKLLISPKESFPLPNERLVAWRGSLLELEQKDGR